MKRFTRKVIDDMLKDSGINMKSRRDALSKRIWDGNELKSERELKREIRQLRRDNTDVYLPHHVDAIEERIHNHFHGEDRGVGDTPGDDDIDTPSEVMNKGGWL